MATLPIAATLTPTTGSPFQFHGWKGWVDDLSPMIDQDHRTGQSGTVAQQVGTYAETTECVGIRYELTLAGMQAFAARAAILPSPTAALLVDPFGRSMRARIHKAMVAPMRVRGPVDGTVQTQYQITVTMSVERFS
jgi:hypothetical protein